jgi:L-rhamnose mutarotase
MSTYNEEYAAIWNQPRAKNPTYFIKEDAMYLKYDFEARAEKYLYTFQVMEDNQGWKLGISPIFKTRQDAEQFIKELTK